MTGLAIASRTTASTLYTNALKGSLGQNLGLGKVLTLPEFLETTGKLKQADKERIVEQALLMIQEVYVHLPLKRAMHAVDPVQRLKLLERKLGLKQKPMTERQFHNEMLSIFTSLRDLHTNYVLPEPYRSHVAFLPFVLEEYFERHNKNQCRYVAKTADGFKQGTFENGVIITYWNGVPIERAVELNADRNAGGNPDARHARGLENMTLRGMSMSLPPDEEWVTITYETPGGKTDEVRLPWLVYRLSERQRPAGEGEEAHFGRGLGLDLQGEILRNAKLALLKPEITRRQKLACAQSAAAVRRGLSDGVDLTKESIIPGVLAFGTVRRQYGYLRIFSFMPPENVGVDGFVDEVVRILGLLPKEGLILDVRGNGGGIIMCGERLLQLFTPQRVEPEKLHFINTRTTLQLAKAYTDLRRWSTSIAQAVETGSDFSSGFPLETESQSNLLGQRYAGPVVLITDARCYSTTDIFAAGFQDHQIGPILGTSGNTGAGGANVWTHRNLQKAAPGVFKELPGGAEMRVSVRRTTRVAAMAGVPVEDLGVIPDEVHKLTREDVLGRNKDLIDTAVKLLRAQTQRTLSGVVSRTRQLSIRAKNIDRVDVYVNSRPTLSRDLDGERMRVTLPPEPKQLHRVLLQGYSADKLVVSSLAEFEPDFS